MDGSRYQKLVVKCSYFLVVLTKAHGGDANVQICRLASGNGKCGSAKDACVFSNAWCLSTALMSS